MNKHDLIVDLVARVVREILETGACSGFPDPLPVSPPKRCVMVRVTPREKIRWPSPGDWDTLSVSYRLALDCHDEKRVSLAGYSRLFGYGSDRVKSLIQEEGLRLRKIDHSSKTWILLKLKPCARPARAGFNGSTTRFNRKSCHA